MLITALEGCVSEALLLYGSIDRPYILWFEHETNEWNLEREWCESYVTFVTNVKQEMAIGGDATRHFCAPFCHSCSSLQKTNNFEPFFSDLTLTFLTSRNTFRLPILPIRRAVLLCLPQISLCLPLIFLCLPQIFPGCASKSPILKGK